MAGDGNYLGQMLAAGQDPGTDVVGNLNRGMQFGQSIQNIPAQNMFRQEKMREMEKQKQIDAAIKQYGQTGDIKALQAIDPVMAMNAAKANDYIKSQPPESIKDMEAAYGQLGRIGPMVNQQNWPDIRKRMIAAHPNLSANDLPPENASGDQIFKFVNAVPLLNAQLKLAGQAPKVLRPNDTLMGPQGPIYRAPPAPTSEKDQAIIEQKRALIGKYGADIEIKIKDLAIKQAKLDFEKTKPDKGGTYNEATAYDKATSYANKVLSDDMVVREAVNKQLATQDPDWSKRTPEEKVIARQKIMPQVREELKKHLIDSYMNERRQRAGAGTGPGKTAPAKSLQSMTTEELRLAIQRAESGGGGAGEAEE